MADPPAARVRVVRDPRATRATRVTCLDLHNRRDLHAISPPHAYRPVAKLCNIFNILNNNIEQQLARLGENWRNLIIKLEI